MRALLNPHVRRDAAFRGLFTEAEHDGVQAYFASRPDLPATPLTPLPSLAHALDLRELYVKDETRRYGLNAFKISGVRYAVHRLGAEVRRGLVCATAGNHGRAVARAARDEGAPCTVFLPAARTSDELERRTRAARADAMRRDGAAVVDVDGTYEEAVRRAAAFAQASGAIVVSDTAWEGYEQIPRWIMAGYTRVLAEAAAQWPAPPDAVIVQGGVGGLVAAAASWLARTFGGTRPFLVAAEPERAACLLESAEAGHPVTIGGTLETIMAGLRCAEPSPAAWPAVRDGVDAFVSVPDALARGAMHALSEAPEAERILAGPSGACGLAALFAICREPSLEPIRSVVRMDRALVIVTEGA